MNNTGEFIGLKEKKEASIDTPENQTGGILNHTDKTPAMSGETLNLYLKGLRHCRGKKKRRCISQELT